MRLQSPSEEPKSYTTSCEPKNRGRTKSPAKAVVPPSDDAEQTVAYGSFTDMQPSESSNNMRMEYPQRIEILEPSGSKRFKAKYYFLALYSKKDLQVDVSVRSEKQLHPREIMQKLAKHEIENKIDYKKKVDPAK